MKAYAESHGQRQNPPWSHSICCCFLACLHGVPHRGPTGPGGGVATCSTIGVRAACTTAYPDQGGRTCTMLIGDPVSPGARITRSPLVVCPCCSGCARNACVSSSDFDGPAGHDGVLAPGDGVPVSAGGGTVPDGQPAGPGVTVVDGEAASVAACVRLAEPADTRKDPRLCLRTRPRLWCWGIVCLFVRLMGMQRYKGHHRSGWTRAIHGPAEYHA